MSRRVPAEELSTVTTLPEEPVTDHVPMVFWFVINRTVWATVFVEASSLNELNPEIDVIDVPVVPPMVSLLNDKSPPLNCLEVALVSEKRIVEVLAFNVRFVDVDVVQTVLVPLKVHVPDPIVMVRTLLFDEANVVEVRL